MAWAVRGAVRLAAAARPSRSLRTTAAVLAGHSKWANIKHKKARADETRMKAFSKTSRLLTAATKVGGPLLEDNPRLADIVASARAINMPKALIDGAIKRGSDPDTDSIEELWYEGTGPEGCAIVVQCFSDNKNRTRDLVRSAFTKQEGSFGATVGFLFEARGEVVVVAEPEQEDEVLAVGMDAGADDVEWGTAMDVRVDEEVSAATVIVDPADAAAAEEAFCRAGWHVLSAGTGRHPSAMVEIPEDKRSAAMALLGAIEEVDGVENVFHNCDFGDEDEDGDGDEEGRA